jgi:hypothetical protein
VPNWAVEEHPKKTQIIKSLISGVSQRTVGDRYDISKTAIQRYLTKHLAEVAAKAVTERTLTDGNSVLTEIEKIIHRMRMMLDACHEYLQDPDNKEKYFLGPRENEIDVVYREFDEEGKPSETKRATLEELRKEIATGRQVLSVHYKYADPRRLILDTADTLTRQLELIGKIQGLVQDVTINISRIECWPEIKIAIFDETKDAPEIREKIVARFAKIAGA